MVHFQVPSNLGPDTWSGVCKNGSRQSPINIDPGSVLNKQDIDELEFKSYDIGLFNVTIENNGHTGMAAL